MSATATTIERITGKLSDQPLLFQYTIKLVLLVAFLELILYRLVSRLGMHLSKLAADHQWIIPTFTALTEVGQWLLNVVAILLFLGLTVGMVNRLAHRGFTGLTRFVVPCIALLLLLTVGFLFVPPSMLGSAIYNTVALAAIVLLMSEYLATHHDRSHRVLGLTYLLRAMLTSWLTKPTADSPTPSLDRDAAGTVSPYHNRFERPIRSDSGFYQRRTRRILFSPRSQM